MDHTATHRPRVSRETRRLLITAFVALAALWVLAGIRFPDRPAAQNPVQPLLTQLAPPPRFDDLAREIGEVELRVKPLLTTVPAQTMDAPPQPALRIRNDVAAVLLRDEVAAPMGAPDQVMRFDRASRLALARVPSLAVPPPVPWLPAGIERPRYMLATHMTADGPSIRPVFVSGLTETDSPVWPGPVLMLPASVDLAAGSFVFTSDGRLAGLVVDHGGHLALVPGPVVLEEVERLLLSQSRRPGRLGIEVQPLTALIAKATGASKGVVVRSVDPTGPAAAQIRPGDVLESVNGNAVLTALHWDALVARMTPGDAVTIQVRTPSNSPATSSKEVSVAVAPVSVARSGELGLTLRNVAGVGVMITRVAPESLADRAGLRAGDIITRLALLEAPGAAALRRAFDEAAPGDVLVLALSRDGEGIVVALPKE